jgi:hypothetical protein
MIGTGPAESMALRIMALTPGARERTSPERLAGGALLGVEESPTTASATSLGESLVIVPGGGGSARHEQNDSVINTAATLAHDRPVDQPCGFAILVRSDKVSCTGDRLPTAGRSM